MPRRALGRRRSKTFTQARQRTTASTKHAREQAAVARLGHLALSGATLSALITEATEIVAQTLRVEYSKVLELLPDREALLLRGGVGWKRGYVGRAKVPAATDSQAGYTLISKHPVVSADVRKEKRFTAPSLLSSHRVVSGISTIILGRKKPYGILGAHSTQRRTYKREDINFMRAIANVLATAIES